MAKRFTKTSIDWNQIKKMVPPEQMTQYLAFKGKSDGYLRRVLANSPEPPKINWEEYKKMVPVEGLVDKFKSEYEALKVPYPEDTLTRQIDEQWKSLQPQIKAFVADRQKEIDHANAELKRIEALPKFEDITMEMFYDLYPQDAIDSVKRPTFWPHNPEEQLGYEPPQQTPVKKK